MAIPKIMLVTTDRQFAKTAKTALGGAVVLSMTDSGEKALKAFEGHAYTVVIADLALTGMDGRAFLAAAKKKHPLITRVAVAEAPDFDQAKQLVNTADISWLLTKPCKAEDLRAAIQDSVSRHRHGKAESKAMRNILTGGVKMLVEILGLTHPEAVRRSKRILPQAQILNRKLKAMSPQLLDMVVLLSHIGWMGLPKELLRKVETGNDITKEEMRVFRTHPQIAAKLLENIPRMGKIAEIIRHQNTPYAQKPPLGARILKACIDLDQLRAKKGNVKKALTRMHERPDVYDPAVIKVLIHLGGNGKKHRKIPLAVTDLKPGMIMLRDMVTEEGNVLLHKGECLSEASHIRLTTFNDLIKVKEPIHAVMRDDAT